MRAWLSLPLDDWRAAQDMAQAGEEAGFFGLATSELAHDPFAPLILASTRTGRVKLATSIVVAFPRSPMVVAATAWDLQTNSGGRFQLGLGTQVKGHNERRFSVPWLKPVARMREYVEALRAIWRCWETGGRLDYQGEHYRFTLMTPEFAPKPSGLPMVPITIAAVGPDMLRLAGRLCDGARLHGFCTRRYVEQVCLPRIEEGLAASGRARANFEISGGGFVTLAADQDGLRGEIAKLRHRVGFYGSTRTYLGVFAAHGLEDLGLKLHKLSVEGKWDQLAQVVPEEILPLFSAIGTYRDIGQAVAERYGGAVDSIRLEFPAGTPAGLMREVADEVAHVPSAFQGFSQAA
ncbi:MAG: TIGR03617 family F420-dependent LLM class oxidoreductase [Alphaproteobacteria bacterium]|nr:TIGR03617 family F420-dependent LLM class oxidoreductase [Alphaproteobacteria bacterium]